MVARELQTLSRAECLDLLATRPVGRLVYVDEHGPAAVPVNFAMSGEEVVCRVSGGSKRAAVHQPCVAFEVDYIDENDHTGWSVLIRGRGAEIPIERVRELLRELHQEYPHPWATGVHNVWLMVTPTLITGRRLGALRTDALV
jgi:nitroimidazol reductase NimA-like FMN-containing flavoprotein (pyridoxamine 5'-phosphate oxidase superfamily)